MPDLILFSSTWLGLPSTFLTSVFFSESLVFQGEIWFLEYVWFGFLIRKLLNVLMCTRYVSRLPLDTLNCTDLILELPWGRLQRMVMSILRGSNLRPWFIPSLFGIRENKQSIKTWKGLGRVFYQTSAHHKWETKTQRSTRMSEGQIQDFT